ncbi:7063_t:CDS:2, partial [Racocetra fulgida]
QNDLNHVYKTGFINTDVHSGNFVQQRYLNRYKTVIHRNLHSDNILQQNGLYRTRFIHTNLQSARNLEHSDNKYTTSYISDLEYTTSYISDPEYTTSYISDLGLAKKANENDPKGNNRNMKFKAPNILTRS